MQKNDNQSKRIYLKSTRQWVDVPEEFYKEYTRHNDALRKRMQSHGFCTCPRNKWWLCDGACDDCEYHLTTNTAISLDYTVDDGEGNEKSLLDDIPDPSQDIQSIVEDRELLDALFKKLDELDPEGRKICELVGRGLPEREAAAEMGLARNTFVYRRDKLLASIREDLKSYI